MTHKQQEIILINSPASDFEDDDNDSAPLIRILIYCEYLN